MIKDPLLLVMPDHRRIALNCLDGVIVHTPGRGVDALTRCSWEKLTEHPNSLLYGSTVLLTQSDLLEAPDDRS